MRKKKISSDRKRSRPVEKLSKLKTIKRNKLLMGAILIVIAIVAIAAAYMVYNYVGIGTNGTDEEGNPIAVIDTSMGTIKIELYEDKAPNTCENFIKLVNDGFYDGLVFHRVIDNFMIQTGAFNSDGSQKESPYGNIELEIDEDLRHIDGAVTMARQGQNYTDPTYFDTASSQFYICDGEQSGLNDYYAVFGQVIEGLDIVRNIASVQTTTKYTPEGYPMSNWPIDDIFLNSIKIE